jgi:bacillithiol biosynthesis cysteine-adding enzyme BshC
MLGVPAPHRDAVSQDLLEAYLAGRAGAFLPGHFAAPGDRRHAVERAVRPLAADIADTLVAQNARLAPSPARDAHVAALRAGAAAVVTGQQMGLFLGPLFTLYKAATAIRLARTLGAESGRPVVPVFWLQTEDHDLAEIAVCHVPCDAGPRALTLPASPDDRVSIAHRLLPAEVRACLAVLEAELGRLPHATPHLERLTRHYQPGRAWSDAFAHVLAELFTPEGLVLLDPRDPTIAAAAAPLHRRALAGAATIADALLARSRDLERAGFVPTVHVRPGAPLSFFHPDGAEGPRYRLTPAGDGYALVGRAGHYTLDALLAAAPLQFSSSALLRPIVQDSLLPTAAYVGGPAEVAYFAQLAPLYAAYDLAMPLVVPRARLRIVEKGTARTLARLRLTPEDACSPDAERLAAARHADASALAGRVLAPFADALDALRAEVEPALPGVDTAFDKTRGTVESAVHRLTAKIEKARLHADEDAVAAVRRVRQMLWPHDQPQERIYGLAYFAARHGERTFLERVLDAADPLDARPRDLALEAG